MYNDLMLLQKKYKASIMYMDTDSVICILPKDGDMDGLRRDFKLGSKAYGAMKEEARNIKAVAIAGPKNYALKVSIKVFECQLLVCLLK